MDLSGFSVALVNSRRTFGLASMNLKMKGFSVFVVINFSSVSSCIISPFKLRLKSWSADEREGFSAD